LLARPPLLPAQLCAPPCQAAILANATPDITDEEFDPEPMLDEIYGPAPPPTAHSLSLPPLPVILPPPRRQRVPVPLLPLMEHRRIMHIQVMSLDDECDQKHMKN